MRQLKSRWGHWTCVGLVACSISATGCKSGWKMPGKDLFSWNKKPSETTLAGQGPSMTYPSGPAANHTPTAIASTPTPKTSAPNFQTAAYAGGTTSAPGTMPSSAAAANNYQVGPYGMGNSGAPNSLANTTSPVLGGNAAASGAGLNPAFANSNPAALAANRTAQPAATGQPFPSVQTYSGAQQNPYGYRAANPAGMASNAQPNMANTANMPNMANMNNMAQSNNPYAASSGTPTYAPPTNTGNGLNPPGANFANAGYAPSSNQAYSQPTSAATNPGYPSSAVNPYATTNNGAVASAGGYRPGSTSRTTTYDYTQPASSTSTASNSGLVPPPAYNATPLSAPGQNVPMMATPPAGSMYSPPTMTR